MKSYSLKLKILVLGIVVFSFLFLAFRFGRQSGSFGVGSLDAFAQCLASKKITMYGAASCSHCQNEKKAFGKSFKYVPYVECPADPQRCAAAGIDGYPTWILGDGKKLVGEQGLEKLSQESGCSLNRK